MKFIEIYEDASLNSINYESIEAVVLDQAVPEIKIVCKKYCYVEKCDTAESARERYVNILSQLKGGR